MLNRPDKRNALTAAMITELTNIFHKLDEDEGTRRIVLGGVGKIFCAGADIANMRQAAQSSIEDNVADGQAIFDLMSAVDGCSKPTVGRIQGAAIGGGGGLACCCDIVVATQSCKFGFSETRLGILPAVISPFVLGKISPTYARQLFLTGEIFDAQTAYRIGMAHYIALDENELDHILEKQLFALAQAAPGAQAEAKRLIRQVAFQPKNSQREMTTRLIANRRASHEGQEGMSAFLEKRKPWWQISATDAQDEN